MLQLPLSKQLHDAFQNLSTNYALNQPRYCTLTLQRACVKYSIRFRRQDRNRSSSLVAQWTSYCPLPPPDPERSSLVPIKVITWISFQCLQTLTLLCSNHCTRRYCKNRLETKSWPRTYNPVRKLLSGCTTVTHPYGYPFRCKSPGHTSSDVRKSGKWESSKRLNDFGSARVGSKS